MGLLDDAIREHLDLKRRRGGDPADIERAEREALGPVRRNRDPAADESDPLIESRDALPGSARDEPDEGVAADLVDEHPTLGGEGGPIPAPAAAESSFVDEDDPFDDADEPFAPDEEPFADDAPATRVMRAADIPPPAERTAEYDVEEAFADDDPLAESAAPEGSEGEDVLEETPDFLQDTPDHDRLWFEQRPPRDFDFDG